MNSVLERSALSLQHSCKSKIVLKQKGKRNTRTSFSPGGKRNRELFGGRGCGRVEIHKFSLFPLLLADVPPPVLRDISEEGSRAHSGNTVY